MPNPAEPNPAEADGAALRALLEDHEGRRAFAYRDTVGKLTIGVGRNLTDRGLEEGEIDLLLANDIAVAAAACADIFGPSFAHLAAPRRHALISMAFNMGGPRLAGFRRMRAAITANNWTAAAAEALDSRWAAQTGRRAQHIARMLRDDRPLHFPQRTIRRDHVRDPD